MGSYFAERFDALQGLPGAVASNPGLFIILFLVFIPLIVWKWWVVGKSTKKAMADPTHGLRTDADRKKVRHETGIGTTEVLVMRPNGVGGMIWFVLILFGAGALFYAFLVLPDEPTSENWWTFAGLAGFAICAMGLIEANQTRLIVGERHIERRRVLYARDRIAFDQIASVEPLGKSFVRGLKVISRDGRSMRVPARFSGYRELMERLGTHDPALGFMAKLARAA